MLSQITCQYLTITFLVDINAKNTGFFVPLKVESRRGKVPWQVRHNVGVKSLVFTQTVPSSGDSVTWRHQLISCSGHVANKIALYTLLTRVNLTTINYYQFSYLPPLLLSALAPPFSMHPLCSLSLPFYVNHFSFSSVSLPLYVNICYFLHCLFLFMWIYVPFFSVFSVLCEYLFLSLVSLPFHGIFVPFFSVSFFLSE